MKLPIHAIVILLASTFATQSQANETVQPVQVATTPLDAAKLQEIINSLPRSISNLRAGDRVTRLAPAPALTYLQIVGVLSVDRKRSEPIPEYRSTTQETFSSAPFEVYVFEHGYGRSFADFGVVKPMLIDSQLMCSQPSWHVCRSGETAEGFMKIWRVNPNGSGQFKSWSSSINGRGDYSDTLYIQ